MAIANDPKHASYLIEDFFEEHGVNWWPTPPESPDLNPIGVHLNNTYEIHLNRETWMN